MRTADLPAVPSRNMSPCSEVYNGGGFSLPRPVSPKLPLSSTARLRIDTSSPVMSGSHA